MCLVRLRSIPANALDYTLTAGLLNVGYFRKDAARGRKKDVYFIDSLFWYNTWATHWGLR